MSVLVSKLASLVTTVIAMACLLLSALVVPRSDAIALSWLALPIGLLAVNLFAAILTNRAFRLQSALLLFHVGLFGILLLAGGGVLTRLDARVEIVEGERFDPERVQVVSAGWLYPGGFDAIDFVQGPVAVDYRDGLQRGRTQSEVRAAEGGTAMVIGDRRGLVAGGHRLLATFNKGYALLFEWRGDDGSRGLVAINLPSYPEYEWRQRNDWRTPAGEPLIVELVLGNRVPDSGPWTLSSLDPAYTVALERDDGSTLRLAEGRTVRLQGGTLTVADLRLWMGYRIDYDPFLPWLLATALLTLAALGWHFQRKFSRTARKAATQPAPGGATA